MKRVSILIGLMLWAGCQYEDPIFVPVGDVDAGVVDAPGPVADAPVDSGSPPDAPDLPDRDEDLVPDAEDNCPDVSNPGQFDEDSDGVGNVCDNCPAAANPQQENTQENPPDALGDACDPQPGERNEIVLFTGFDDPAELANWDVVRGDWQITGGVLDQSDQLSLAEIHYASPVGSNDIRVETIGAYRDRASGGQVPSFLDLRGGGVRIEVNPGSQNEYACWMLHHRGTNSDGYTVMKIESSGQATYVLNPAFPFQEDVLYLHRAEIDGDNKSCLVHRVGSQPGTAQVRGDSSFNGSHAGLLTSYTRGQFQYFYVITLVDG